MNTTAFTMPVNFTADEYAQLGSELEHGSADDLLAFGIAYANAGDVILATLATYARQLSQARRYRLDGYIEQAAVYESYAEREYRRLPEDCRW